MPPILKHQDIVREILILFALVARKLGGKAYGSPIEVRLDESNVFEPDVLYIKPENLAIAQQDDKRIIGAPNLVVEVLNIPVGIWVISVLADQQLLANAFFNPHMVIGLAVNAVLPVMGYILLQRHQSQPS